MPKLLSASKTDQLISDLAELRNPEVFTAWELLHLQGITAEQIQPRHIREVADWYAVRATTSAVYLKKALISQRIAGLVDGVHPADNPANWESLTR